MTIKRRMFLTYLSASTLSGLPLLRRANAQTATPLAQNLIMAARTQIGVTLTYDGSYSSLDYPNGDVSRELGVCTDVIIRAYRDAFAFDLQRAVHQDMQSAFDTYPKIWGLSWTDRNIDHRRVPNLETFFTRETAKLDLPDSLSALKAGDLLTMRLPRNLPHIAIVTDKTTASGMPHIIHNIGAGTCEEPLSRYGLETQLHSRFRYLKKD